MPQLIVQILGVNLDASLSTEAQVMTVAKLVFYRLLLVRQLTPYLSSCNLATVIYKTVTSRTDYCNSPPLSLTWKLQLVQNAVACQVTATSLWA